MDFDPLHFLWSKMGVGTTDEASKIDSEFILVNDGSDDKSYQELKPSLTITGKMFEITN